MALYNKLSDTPYTVMISPKLLEERLSAVSYNNNFLSFMQAVTNSNTPFVDLGEHFSISAMIGWKNLTTEDYVNQGIKMLRVVDIRDRFINLEDTVQVSPHKVQEQPQIHLKTGDIVYSKDGTLGIAAVVPEISELLCAGSTLARVRLKKQSRKILDQYFIAAFLNCEFAKSQVSYYTNGIAQPHITQEYIAKLRIPIPDPKIQAYIGDMVRLAERCREEALISKTRASEKLKEQIQHNEHEDTTHYAGAFKKLLDIPYCVLIKPELLSERLTAVSYNNNFLEFMALVDASECIFVELGEHYDISAMIGWKNLTTADYVRQGIKMLRVTDISGCFVLLNDAVQVSSSKVDEQPQIHLQNGDVIFSKDGTLGIAAVMPQVDELVCAGSTLARLRKKTQLLDPYYLCAFLNSPYTVGQISYYISGIAQPHITQEYIKQIKVPLLPTSAQLEIGREFHRYDFMSRTAYDLISGAKHDVEKLIVGELSITDVASEDAQHQTWDAIEKRFDSQAMNYA